MTSTDQLREPTRESGVAQLGSAATPDPGMWSSQLFPFLSLRLIGRQELLSRLDEWSPEGLRSPLGEALLWRFYCTGWLENYPQAWLAWRRLVQASLSGWQDREDYQSAVSGNTGIELFDNWIQRLKESGSLNLQEAKCFASLWIYSLKLPWSLGADLFCRYSLDTDLAVHLINWRLVAGSQVKDEHFAVTAQELTDWFGASTGLDKIVPSPVPPRFPSPPKLAHSIDYPTLPGDSLGSDYAVLVTPDDLSLEELARKAPQAKCVVLLDSSFGLERSTLVRTFIDSAVGEAADRARKLLPSSPVVVLSDQGGLLAEQIQTSLSEYRVASMVYHQPAVGEWQGRLLELARKDVGLRYFPLQRAWDGRCLGLATKGFRNFQKLAPEALLDSVG